MLLNDNEYSLQTISEKTNITIENLENLQNREWDKLKRAQAIGLLSIIEREFDVDLSAVKEDANNFYKQNREKEPERIIDLVDAQSIGGSGNKIVSNIVTIVTLGAIAYASWYYFIDSKDSNKIMQNSQNATQESSGMFSNTIESVKKLLGVSSSIDMNGSTSSNSKIKNSTKVILESNKLSDKKDNKSDTTNSVSEKNSTVNKEEKTTLKKEEESKKFDITSVASNSAPSNVTTNDKIVATPNGTKDLEQNNNANEESNKIKESNKSVKSEVDKLLSELDENNSKSKEEDNRSDTVEDNLNSDTTSAAIENESTLENNSSEINSSKSVEPAITNLDIKVKSKRLWMGIYNLTTGKKINKIAKGKFSLNVGNDKFAIITGHNRFELVTDNGVKKFTKKGKVYFTVSKDGIKELTRREYKTLTKRRAW